jgi:hypothetical protein
MGAIYCNRNAIIHDIANNPFDISVPYLYRNIYFDHAYHFRRSDNRNGYVALRFLASILMAI